MEFTDRGNNLLNWPGSNNSDYICAEKCMFVIVTEYCLMLISPATLSNTDIISFISTLNPQITYRVFVS